jgi:uncharacterized protein
MQIIKPESNKELQKRIITFLILTFALSSIFYYFIISNGEIFAGNGFYILGLMWCPGLSAIITQILYRKSLSELGWIWGKTKYQLWSYAIPFFYALVTYSIIWATGLGIFSENQFEKDISSNLTQIIGVNTQTSYFLPIILGIIWLLVSALGEEIGWRGFLVPQLAKMTSFTKTALVSGIIWAIWHYPLIIFTDYNGRTTTFYSLFCFTLCVIGISFVFAWLRLKSGSLWTGVLLHTSDNIFVSGIFDALTKETAISKYIIGEFGIALAIASIVVGYIFWKKRTELDIIQAITPKTIPAKAFNRKGVLTNLFG